MLANRVRIGSRKTRKYRMTFVQNNYMYKYDSYISYRYDGGSWINVNIFENVVYPIDCEEVQFKVTFIKPPRRLYCHVKINENVFFQAESSIENTFISDVYKLYKPITVDMEIY